MSDLLNAGEGKCNRRHLLGNSMLIIVLISDVLGFENLSFYRCNVGGLTTVHEDIH